MGGHIMNRLLVIVLTATLSLVPSFALAKEKEEKEEKIKKEKIEKSLAVPEINAASTTIALALLAGLVLVARERRQSEKS